MRSFWTCQPSSISKYFFVWACLVSLPSLAQEPKHNSAAPRTVLFEVVRNSWDAQRNETLLYLRVYSDGFAEADPMQKIDFRNIRLETKQLSGDEMSALQGVLNNPTITQLRREYDGNWRNKDFGYRLDVTIFASSKEQRIALVNFQPFLARKEGKPYPQDLESSGVLSGD
jgi:hypothetical protein